jgi:hypothetical protein
MLAMPTPAGGPLSPRESTAGAGIPHPRSEILSTTLPPSRSSVTLALSLPEWR